MRTALVCLILTFIASAVLAESPEWKFDIIHRKKGDPFSGLILQEQESKVVIRCIIRKRGSPTVTYTEIVPRVDIHRIEALTEKEREELKGRLDSLKRERQVLTDHLRSLDPKSKDKIEMVDLEEIEWPNDKKVIAQGYKSTHFQLIADTRPELARLAAIHLEQVYTAYARSLPPRVKGQPTTILLTRSLASYAEFAKGRGIDIFNPAFYDPGQNQVVCGSDLERMCDELKKARDEHTKLRAAIKERRAELIKAYRDKSRVPQALLDPLADAEKKMLAVDQKNDEAFARSQQRLFRRLYHEAFHAYLGTFVYPAKEHAVPHWLNEGLAQIFETAIVEVGELRVGHPDDDRLSAVRAAIKEDKLLPLTDLLKATPRMFLVAHAKDQQVSDRYYLASWALAFHLTFERKLLGTKALNDYVSALKREADPLTAFAELVGEPVTDFDKKHLGYLKKLR